MNSNNSRTFLASFLLLAVFFVALSPALVMAQKTTLRVRVLSNKSGIPLIGATVRLFNYKGKKLEHGDATNKYGFVGFHTIKAKKYRLVVNYIGFKTYKKVIELKKGETKNITVKLKIAVSSLNELTVTGGGERRHMITGHVGVHQISRAAIERVPSPSASGDLASYLRTLPGIIEIGDRGGGLYVRGGIPSQNKVLVDNMPIVKPFHILNLYSAFPAQTVQNVIVYTGGFGAKYTDANSAVIDVTLRPGNYKHFRGTASVSPYLTSLELEGPISKGRTSFLLFGRHSLIAQTSPLLYQKNKHIKFSDYTGRFSYHSENIACNVTGVFTYDRGRIAPIRKMALSWRNYVIGGHCFSFSPNYKNPFNITAGYSYYQNKQASQKRKPRISSINHIFIKFSTFKNLSDRISLNYGFNFNAKIYNATLDKRFTSHRTYHSELTDISAYFSMEWEHRFFKLKPSVGFVYLGFDTRPALEPRLRVSYHPGGSQNSEISLAGGLYYQTKTAIRNVREAGNIFKLWKNATDTKGYLPSSVQVLLEYRQRIGHFVFNIGGYIKNYDRILVPKWTPISEFSTQLALANGIAHGGDLVLKYTNNPFFFSVKYGYAFVKFKAASKNLGAWISGPLFSYHPAFDQRHKLNILGSYQTRFLNVSASWSFGTGRPYTQVYAYNLNPGTSLYNWFNRHPFIGRPRPYPTPSTLRVGGTAYSLFNRPYGARLPTYHRLDISMWHTFNLSNALSLEIKAGVIDLLNRKNIFYFNSTTKQRVNQTGRLPYLTVQAKF